MDGEELLFHRLFQRVKEEHNYDNISTNDFVLHGFAVDEGVRRNRGRQGAKDAPDIIRKNMSNFPVIIPDFSMLDKNSCVMKAAICNGKRNKIMRVLQLHK